MPLTSSDEGLQQLLDRKRIERERDLNRFHENTKKWDKLYIKH